MVEHLGLVGDIRPSVAFATCAAVPDLDADTRKLLAPLADLGVDATPQVWDDRSVDWSRFDLTVVRSCWDHDEKRAEFLTWAASIRELANPAQVLEWNADRRYLAEFAEDEFPVVPTTWLAPGDPWYLPDDGLWVVKSAAGMAGLDSGLYDVGRPGHRVKMAGHMARLLRSDQHVMVQPYLPTVASAGETSLVYLAGAFSHAVRRSFTLQGPDQVRGHRITSPADRRIELVQPTFPEQVLARSVLDAVPRSCDLLCAQVDLVPDDHGSPLLLEVGLTTPQLFLSGSPDADVRLATIIAEWATTCRGAIRASLPD